MVPPSMVEYVFLVIIGYRGLVVVAVCPLNRRLL